MTDAPRPTPLVHAHELAYRFPDGRPALQGLSLEVQAGESVGLIGPNGAGKTTFFLTLLGVLKPQAGELTVAGLDARDPEQLPAVRRRLGMVFQNTDDQLFSASAYDDVAFGPLYQDLPADEVAQRVAQALDAVGACELAGRVSHHLSAGEKRRVALACALALEPALLVLDEPTNDLDPRARRGLIDLLATLPQTLLIATHDLEFVLDTCDRAVIIDAGRCVAAGPTRAVLANADLLADHGLEVPPTLRAAAG